MTRAEGTGRRAAGQAEARPEPGPTVFAKNLASLCLHGDEIVPKVCPGRDAAGRCRWTTRVNWRS